MTDNLQTNGAIIEAIEEKLKKKETYGALYNFDTVEKLREGIEAYFSYIDSCNNPMLDADMSDEEKGMVKSAYPDKKTLKVANLSGLAKFLKTTTFKLRDYTVNEDYREILDDAIQRMEAEVVDLSMSGRLNINWVKFYMKNIHMWEEQSTVKTVKEEKQNIGIYIIQPKIKEEDVLTETKNIIEMNTPSPENKEKAIEDVKIIEPAAPEKLSDEENDLMNGFG